MPDQESRITHTAIGDFEEIQNGVRVSSRVDRTQLQVQAEVSNTGAVIDLSFAPNTVIISTQDREAFTAKAQDKENLPAMREGLSLLSEWAKAVAPGSTTPAARVVRDFVSPNDEGFKVSRYNGGFIIRTDADATRNLLGATGLNDINELRPEAAAYAHSFSVFATDHELHHFNGADTKTGLGEEIRADFGALRDHFNKPFQDFAMDMRAIGALNNMVKDKDDKLIRDDHHTHIWTEESGSGALPDESQEKAIMDAPLLIQQRAIEYFSQASDMTPSAVEQNLSNTAARLATYRTLREVGAFNDIPYANEFVDKYIQAADRRYSEGVLKEAAGVQQSYNDVAAQAALDHGLSAQAAAPVRWSASADLSVHASP